MWKFKKVFVQIVIFIITVSKCFINKGAEFITASYNGILKVSRICTCMISIFISNNTVDCGRSIWIVEIWFVIYTNTFIINSIYRIKL